MFMNASAPSLIKAEHMTAAMHVLQYVMSDDDRSLGLAVLPAYTYVKNNLWNEMNAVVKHLVSTGAHCDRSWYLQFKEKCDQRDDRPLTYQGKICVPAAQAEETAKGFWKKSPLFLTGRTELARQVPGKEMRSIDCMSENSLPSTTDTDGSVKGAAKYGQLGSDACLKTLQAVLDAWRVSVNEKNGF